MIYMVDMGLTKCKICRHGSPTAANDVADGVTGHGAAARPGALRPRAGRRLGRLAQARLGLRHAGAHGREGVRGIAAGGARVGHERPAETPVSRHPLRSQSPRRVCAAARRARPQTRGGAMTFEARVIAFAERFLSDRAYQLIVVPALADLQFDKEAGRRSLLRDRVSVLRAVAGAVGDDVGRECYSVFKLSLLSVAYFMFPLALGISAFKTWTEFMVVATLVLGLAMAPVIV